jgi:hypothetical protein
MGNRRRRIAKHATVACAPAGVFSEHLERDGGSTAGTSYPTQPQMSFGYGPRTADRFRLSRRVLLSSLKGGRVVHARDDRVPALASLGLTTIFSDRLG